MTRYLDLEADLDGVFLHPGGPELTAVLLDRLGAAPGRRWLEVGCGVGATTALAAGRGVHVVALDRSPPMLAAARRRLASQGVLNGAHLLRADAACPLPFPDAVFDAVYAESVVALLPVGAVLAECARVLRPGGRLCLTERIWKPGVSATQAAQVNALSLDLFGLPAATPTPLDRAGWRDLMASVGLVVAEATPVDDLLPPRRETVYLRRRVGRARRYLADPRRAWRSLRFKVGRRRYEAAWRYLESYLFVADKPL